MSINDSQEVQARNISLMIMLLFALHVLFGVTGIIGVLVAHVSLNLVEGTIYHSHLRWQIKTFWLAFAGYAVSAWLFFNDGLIWPALLVLGFVIYRLAINWHRWVSKSAIAPYPEQET